VPVRNRVVRGSESPENEDARIRDVSTARAATAAFLRTWEGMVRVSLSSNSHGPEIGPSVD